MFSLDPSTGAEAVLHDFGGAGDGENPYASLIHVNGKLYGTTFNSDGGGCCGTVFAVDLGTGTETVLHTFSGADGARPFAGLIAMNDELYGTTRAGGFYGAGAIFSVDLKTGKERVVYSFCAQFGCPDGGEPEAAFINVNGILYSTTVAGGSTTTCPNTNSPPGCGTVFAFDPKTGAETVLYAFCTEQDCTDGAFPEAGLIDVNGLLYSTTYLGGQPAGCYPTSGCGTVFSVDPNTGVQNVLHSFASGTGTDGLQPTSGLLAMRGRFYGTTLFGGANGDGAVFALGQKP